MDDKTEYKLVFSINKETKYYLLIFVYNYLPYSIFYIYLRLIDNFYLDRIYLTKLEIFCFKLIIFFIFRISEMKINEQIKENPKTILEK